MCPDAVIGQPYEWRTSSLDTSFVFKLLTLTPPSSPFSLPYASTTVWLNRNCIMYTMRLVQCISPIFSLNLRRAVNAVHGSCCLRSKWMRIAKCRQTCNWMCSTRGINFQLHMLTQFFYMSQPVSMPSQLRSYLNLWMATGACLHNLGGSQVIPPVYDIYFATKARKKCRLQICSLPPALALILLIELVIAAGI